MSSAPSRLSYVAAAIATGAILAASPVFGAGYLKLGDIKGDVPAAASGKSREIHIESYSWGVTGSRGTSDKWFVADSFGFGVEREMKESGEKGGTEDINIGVGELQEATISKSMDRTSVPLAQPTSIGASRNGSAARGSLSVKVPAGTCKAGARYPTAEMGANKRVYTMTGVVVTGCSPARSGGGSIPTETLSLNFDKVSWKYWP